MTDSIVRHDGDSDSNIKQEILGKPGARTLSFRGTAKLCGVQQSSLTRNLTAKEGDAFATSRLAQRLMQFGFEGDDFLSWKTEGIPAQAVTLIVDYYARWANHTTEEAQAILLTLAYKGIEEFLATAAGDSIEPGISQAAEDPYVLAATRVKEIEANVRNQATRHLLIDKALHAVGLKLPQLPPAPVTYEMTVCEIRDYLKLKPSMRRSNSKMAAAIQRALDAWGCKSWWASLDAATKTYEVTDADLKMLQAVTCIQNWINEDFSQLKLKLKQLDLGLAA